MEGNSSRTFEETSTGHSALKALSDTDKTTLLAVMRILKNQNLKATEEMFKRETGISSDFVTVSSESDGNKALSVYKSEGEPCSYESAYDELKHFVDISLDIHKYELGLVLYPVFVHMYLELVYNEHEEQAASFMAIFGPYQEDYCQDDIKKLAVMTKKSQLSANVITDTFNTNAFRIRMSRDTLSLLKRYLKEKEQNVILNIITKHLYFDMHEGMTRNKKQIDITTGGSIREPIKEENREKIYYGLINEPDLQSILSMDEDSDTTTISDSDLCKIKKLKIKKDLIVDGSIKVDANAPAIDRIPYPEMKVSEKMERVKYLRESAKKLLLGPDSLPSICCYSILNSENSATSIDLSDDISLLAIGLAVGKIMVFTLVSQKLKAMKTAEQLQDVNLESEDRMIRIMDERSAQYVKELKGHKRPVYATSFSPDRTLLISGSGDGLVRLWSLMTWTCLVVYRGHMLPVWDVQFSPRGYYFVSVGNDRVGRLWATDHVLPLRIFSGHYSDVDCVRFHPNCNYIATGSSDRTIRLWDCLTGSQVRLMTGHKGPISVIRFSTDGRFLASAGADENVIVWDINYGHMVAAFPGHTSAIQALDFSRDGNILASGSHDFSIKLWNFSKLYDEISTNDSGLCHNPKLKNSNMENYLLKSVKTKNLPVLNLFFSRRNVLFAVCRLDKI